MSLFDTHTIVDSKINEVPVKVANKTEIKQIKYLGSQMKQSAIDAVKQNASNLKKSKLKGNKIGRLKYKSNVSEITLKQNGITHKLIDNKRIRVQNLGILRVSGIEQIDLSNCEIANGKIIKRADGYFIQLTCFFDNSTKSVFEPREVLGLDMGLKDALVFSNGVKVNYRVEETEQLKNLRRKFSRQIKYSNNWYKTKNRIAKVEQHLSNKKTDVANKVLSVLNNNYIVCFQDENLMAWKRKAGYVRGGKKIQSGILGRVKTGLRLSPQNEMLSRFQPTTQLCPECGCLTKHFVDKCSFRCDSCGFTESDRDIHAAKNMILLSSYGTYGSLKMLGNSADILVASLTPILRCGATLKVVENQEDHLPLGND